MPTLKEIKKRVGSAKTVHKITKAMKLVSASKSRAAQTANFSSKPYSDKIFSLVQDLWEVTDPKAHPLLTGNSSSKRCSIIVTTDKGLCGSLVDNMEDFLIKDKAFEGTGNQFIVIGKKGSDILLKHNKTINAVFELGFKKPNFDFVNPIVKLFAKDYLDGVIGNVTVYYTTFINAFKQVAVKRQILPALKPDYKKQPTDIAIYEPSADAVLESLLMRYLEIQVYQLVLDSAASEHSARMMAMDKATTNAEGIIDDLTLEYNKARQEKITEELLEITTTISALGD